MKKILFYVDTTFLADTVNRSYPDYVLKNLLDQEKFQTIIITSHTGKNHYKKFVDSKSIINISDSKVHGSKIGVTIDILIDILKSLNIDLSKTKKSNIIIYQFTGLIPDVLISLIIKYKLKKYNTVKIYSSFVNFVPHPKSSMRSEFNIINYIPYYSFILTLRLLKLSDHVDCYLSGTDYDYLKKKYFEKVSTKRLIFSIDLDKLDMHKSKRLKKKYDIIYFGRLSKDKGLLEFFEVVKRVLLTKDINILIIGHLDINFKSEFYNLIFNNSIINKINYLGYVKEEELFDYINQSKIFCFLSHYESQPSALLKALYCNLICLTSNIKSLNNDPFDKLKLFRYDRNDYNLISQKMIYFLNNYNNLKKKKYFNNNSVFFPSNSKNTKFIINKIYNLYE